MNKIKLWVWCIGLLFVGSLQLKAQESKINKIWFNSPADALAKDRPYVWDSDPEWLKALPIGNGSLGAMVFGDVNQERIQLNEMTLWSGSRDDEADNPDASRHLGKIRELLFQGKYKEATELTVRTQITKGLGSGRANGANLPFGCFQTLGDLRLDFGTKATYDDYYRELDLMTGVSLTRFSQNGVNFIREVFASHPDQAIIIRLTADRPGAINVRLTMDRPERFNTVALKDELRMVGRMDNGKGGDGMRYMARVIPVLDGGQMDSQGESIQINAANAVTLVVAAKTDYKQQYPEFVNPNFEKELEAVVKKATSKAYNKLKSRHVEDFSSFMKRVDFRLGNGLNNVPTNELMFNNQLSSGNQDLYPLYFQYGRYLLLSSSREGGLPTNLQGIWANKIQTPWNGDYHTDINVQMSYWPAEVTNLSETHRPLFDLMASLSIPGKKTAAVQYQMQGWVLHPITNVWGYTSPGESARWGMHVGGGGWIAQHLWEHYAFTQNKAHLNSAYPMLKEACLFYLDWLAEDPKTGKLVSGPSPSPENSFRTSDGYVSQISMGSSHDQQVIFNLFENTLNTIAVLGINDAAFRKRLQTAKDKLARPKIGSDGRLMEWAEEFEEVEPTHRHMSHLFAMYPGNEITLYKTPELANAVQKSLEVRGDSGVGWTFGWKMGLWARLHNGDRALKLLDRQLRPKFDHSSKTSGGGGGTYYNLFNEGPPFQIDGNFGVVAGVAEMLLQSHEEFIELLPALPKSWSDGEVSGLVARGAMEIDMKWEDGILKDAFIKAKYKTPCKIKYNNKFIELKLSPGKRINLKKVLAS
ncbi:glycosyl hydrolase family 95 catalytic domain-containing protein [Sphingobacterium sp. xlx-130]|uniref:glycoside hydrolase family 95 protein n=1 Tax=Sphingobacterium sp. xlx-130 TaxID=2654323 RepID=UPI0013DAD70C|nr:glycoside hydrolase family 95 protein [Sphingobacterium sp. xlx-130]